jgi:Ser/Thr protein kinase RdoA (MazF antagonist)
VPVAERAAQRWGLPPPVLLRVGMNAIFAAGEVVLRVSRPTAPPAAAIELAIVLSEAGVSVPEPAITIPFEEDGLAVTAWQRLHPIDRDCDWRAVGAMVARVHALDAEGLPSTYPVPPSERFPWWQFDTILPQVEELLDDRARDGLQAAIASHAGWRRVPERVVCHGDVHPGNVLTTASGPVLMDWDLLCRGPPQWDHAMLLRIERWGGRAKWHEEFASGYGRSFAADRLANDIAEARLIAATLMRLCAALQDPAAMPEAQRRLAYWRGDLDAPVWTAV